ncbi:MAG: sulfotransferase [Phormidesmis sp.]
MDDSNHAVHTVGCLPNLIIIGAMKAGTTSLHHYLNTHPEIYMSRQKELMFFLEHENWHRGMAWYQSQFSPSVSVNGESSPNYTNYPRWLGVPQRMHSVVPEAKLIYMLRDPIERIISQYVHKLSCGLEHRTLEAALADFEDNYYIARSQYFLQLQQYLEFFPRESILLLTAEKLQDSPVETMRRVFEFLEVDADFQFKLTLGNASELLKFGPTVANPRFQFDTKLHSSARKRRLKVSKDNPMFKLLSTLIGSLPLEVRVHAEKIVYRPFSEKIERPTMSLELRKRIIDYLADDIRQLKAYTNDDFSEWDLEGSR